MCGACVRGEGDGERQRLLEGRQTVHWQRWYILALFSAFSLETVVIWNTFAPIDVSAKKVFGWTDSTIMQFALWGCLDFPIFFLPAAFLLTYSLRGSVVAGCGCMAIGAALRSLPLLLPQLQMDFTLLCHAGAWLNMMGGPIAMAACPQISAVWFPPQERTTATSISQMSFFLGIGVSNLVGLSVGSIEVDQIEKVEEDINRLILAHAIIAASIFALVCVYFPSFPHGHPGERSGRHSTLLADLRQLAMDRNAWLLVIVFAVSQGLVFSWQSAIVIDLDSPGLEHHISEKFASNLGILISVLSAAFSVFFATVMDRFREKKKTALCFLYLSSGVILVFCSLLAEDVIIMANDATFKSLLSCLLVLGISLATAAAPIATEFCVDLCRPVSEENIGSWLTLWFNLVALVFFLAFQIPGVGVRWLNYILPLSTLTVLPLILVVKEPNREGS